MCCHNQTPPLCISDLFYVREINEVVSTVVHEQDSHLGGTWVVTWAQKLSDVLFPEPVAHRSAQTFNIHTGLMDNHKLRAGELKRSVL